MKSLIFSFACALFTLSACGQAKPEAVKATFSVSTDQKAVEAATKQFLEGADKSDVAALDAVMHEQYRVVLNRVFGNAVTTMDKTAYLKMITDKKIGGVPRQSTILSVVVVENIAAVEVTTTSAKSDLHIFMHFIKEPDGQWRLVSDTPFAKFKS
jgi:ketosteroid isomerase-like protein